MSEIRLDRVPETMLWTLYYRASEARRRDTVLDDPRAVALLDAIDYPFEQRFGRLVGWQAQWQALRARRFDDEVRRFLAEHPDGTVVALGEGLETQFWRVDNGRVRWWTVDLPEAIALRSRLLPAPCERRRAFAGSALELRWADAVDGPVLLTAQGLLMYLQPDEARGLIAALAWRFPGGALVFDAAPRWFSRATQRGKVRTAHYQAPPMPWGFDPAERRRVREIPGVRELHELRLGRGRGAVGRVLRLSSATPVLRGIGLTILLARF